jgi:nucleoside-diphosphate-sugar epimerase
MKVKNLTKILITGASGFVGRNIVEDLCEDFFIFAFARRTQYEVGVKAHKNVKWILVDITHPASLAKVVERITQEGGVEFIIHLAAYYDFDNKPHPEFERTNVRGTRLMLEHSKALGIKRFIFASSIAGCKFPPPGVAVNENSSLDADFPYAIAKKKGEEMLKEYSKSFACSSIRFAAIFGDWCEYGLLYIFLKTWLSASWRSRILGGKGESAIPYIHVNCATRLVSLVLEKSDQLPQFDIYLASPDGSTSHLELFDMATRYYFGEIKHPIFLPKWFATIGVYIRDIFGAVIGKRPFERPWMMKYVDQKLTVEAAYTRKILGWEPRPRYHIMRRLLFLLENLKSFPVQWHQKNTAALAKPTLERPNLILAELMQNIQEEIVGRVLAYLVSPDRIDQFKQYHDLYRKDPTKVKWYVESVYNLLIASVRNGDRYSLINYARSLGKIRSQEGYTAAEVCRALVATGDQIRSYLLALPETKGMKLLIHDWITLAIQLAADEVEDSFEQIARRQEVSAGEEMPNVL